MTTDTVSGAISAIAITLLLAISANADVLVTTTGEGKVSVIPNLSAQDCETARRSLTHEDELEAIARGNDVSCPTDESEGGWAKWRALHPAAFGCNERDGGSIAWGGLTLRATDVEKAECLK